MRIWTVICLLTLACLAVPESAVAQRRGNPGCCGRGYGGWGQGGWGRPYPGPVPGPWWPQVVIAPVIPLLPPTYVPPAVIVPMPPPVTYGMPAAQFVYWCDNPKGYYPNVPTCNGPWREQSATEPR